MFLSLNFFRKKKKKKKKKKNFDFSHNAALRDKKDMQYLQKYKWPRQF